MQPLTSEYWDNRYLESTTIWDLGIISAPLKEYLEKLTDKNISILIPGCGNAHEAEWLMKNGFTNVTLIDIADEAVKGLKAKFKNEEERGHIRILFQDFFLLHQTFDLIIEQTFFCALDPNLRKHYVKQMSSLLSAKGKLVGVLFATEFEKEGPPFGGSGEEYQALFEKHFAKLKIEPCYNSVAPRAGNEFFMIAQK